ncbi:MAG: hypothetical protein NC830_06665, partial [Candidatus Omnitrophica bacterium]|nr:hypothetical protein [Candidatus Omnitrophota bacterium]
CSHLSILPLHHTFECTCGFLIPLSGGSRVTYARSLKSKETLEDIKNTVEGMTKLKEVDLLVGQALVKQVFKIGKNQSVAGCLVVDGKAIRDAKVKIVRNGNFVFEGFLSSLKRFKNSVREVATNIECGIGVAGFNDFQQGDIIQIYQKVVEGMT